MDIIERAKVKCGSWSKLSKELGVSASQMSGIKNGTVKPTAYQLGKCAEICGERWYDHALPALMAQERTEAGRLFWKGKLERLLTIGAMGLVAASLVQVPLNGGTKPGAVTIENNYESDLSNRYYVK